MLCPSHILSLILFGSEYELQSSSKSRCKIPTYGGTENVVFVSVI
jgi:hypothetical protein